MGLEIALMDHRHPVRLLDDHVGLGEALGHVAAVQPRLLRDVDGLGRLGFRLGDRHGTVGHRLAGVGLGPGLGDRGGAGLHRLEGIDGRGQDFVLDLDQVERLLADGRLVSGHGGDRMPDEHHAVDGQHRMCPRRRLALQLRNVGGGEDRPHAGQRARLARVDADDAGMRVRAAEELGVEQAAGLDVRDVLNLTGDLLRTIRARDREPDSLDVARGLHHSRHGYAPSGRMWRRRPR